MATMTRDDLPEQVKFMKEANRLEAKRPYRCPHGVEAPGSCDPCFKKARDLALAAPRRPVAVEEPSRARFYATCEEPGCDWFYNAGDEEGAATNASIKAHAHQSYKHHYVTVRYDIIGQIASRHVPEFENDDIRR